VGRVLKVEKHPNADKLVIAVVDVGEKELRIVCGGTNLKEKMLVPVAMIGAKVRWHGEGDPVEIKKTEVRGVVSDGMICASSEIGLKEKFPHGEREILDLSSLKVKSGTSLGEALGLGDSMLEIDNKSLSNRPDLWGHYGIGREVAALYDLKLKNYDVKKIKNGNTVDLKVNVADKEVCARYLAVAIDGVKVAPSPEWLQARLRAIGQAPINNIVDVTNYILFDLGQPMHAFDAKQIKNNEIVVRCAKDKEKMMTLDNEQRVLTADDLVIADAERIVAIAGVMGGENSQINNDATTIILESTNFDPVSIRKTGQRLNLRTESAIRFEKSLDPNLAEVALSKAVQLILEMCPEAKVASRVIDEKNFNLKQGPIELTWGFIDTRIGQQIDRQIIVKNLTNLGFKVKKSKKGISVIVPTWRATKDISIAEDIIEEITRIFGYDNLSPQLPLATIDSIVPEKMWQLERLVKNILSETLAGHEVSNYSFVSPELLKKIGQPVTNDIELENPPSEEQSLLRKSLLPNLFNNIVDNLRYFDSFKLFEVGKIFIDNAKGDIVGNVEGLRLPQQDLMAAGVIVSAEGKDIFYGAKGSLETLFAKLNLPLTFGKPETMDAWCHPEQCLSVSIGKKVVGYIATLHPSAGAGLGIKSPVGIWEIDLNKIVEHFPSAKKYHPLPKFPAVELDISIVASEDLQWKDVQAFVKTIEPDLVQRCELLDVFRGGTIKAGEKSLTFRITYQAEERTLEMAEVSQLQEKIIEQIEKMGARIRM
ncbi:MAG: phenylalanine--tRNA ligase subunit beta, partial [Parcubacteria group bacterium]